MSLADRIEEDVERIFYRESEFARRHEWNGKEILCIVDNEQALAHGNMNSLSAQWDVGNIDMEVRIPASQLDERPGEGEVISFDGRMKSIVRVVDNEGEWFILMREYQSRSVY